MSTKEKQSFPLLSESFAPHLTYYELNKDRIKLYQALNRERIKEYQANYFFENSQRIYDKQREKSRQYYRSYYLKHKSYLAPVLPPTLRKERVMHVEHSKSFFVINLND